MASSDGDVNILTLVFVLFLYRVEVAALVLRPSRSIDPSGAIIAPYALTTKSDLQLFSPVTYSDEDISIFRGYYCTYQLTGRPVRHEIICKKLGVTKTSNAVTSNAVTRKRVTGKIFQG